MRQHKCLLVFGLRVHRGDVVFVRVVDKLVGRETEGNEFSCAKPKIKALYGSDTLL